MQCNRLKAVISFDKHGHINEHRFFVEILSNETMTIFGSSIKTLAPQLHVTPISMIDEWPQNVNLFIPMIRLASEYDAKPGLAPPLVIIEDIWKLFKSIWKKTCRRKQEDLEALMTRDIEMLELFEKDCLHGYTTLQNSSMEMINDMRLSKLEENVNKVVKLLEEPEMLHQNQNIQEFSELGDQSKPYRNAHLSSKILTAKIRSQSARARESFAILDDEECF